MRLVSVSFPFRQICNRYSFRQRHGVLDIDGTHFRHIASIWNNPFHHHERSFQRDEPLHPRFQKTLIIADSKCFKRVGSDEAGIEDRRVCDWVQLQQSTLRKSFAVI